MSFEKCSGSTLELWELSAQRILRNDRSLQRSVRYRCVSPSLPGRNVLVRVRQCAIHDDCVFLLCSQLRKLGLQDCWAQHPWPKIAKKWVLYDHTRWMASVPFCKNSERSSSSRWRSWSSVHVLYVLCWWESYFAFLCYKTRPYCTHS